MKKKSFSVSKLPQISISKKNHLAQKNNELESKIQQVDKMQRKSIEADFLQTFFIRRKSKILLTPYEQEKDRMQQSPQRSLSKNLRNLSSRSHSNHNYRNRSPHDYENINETNAANQLSQQSRLNHETKSLIAKEKIVDSVINSNSKTGSNIMKLSMVGSSSILTKVDFEAYRTAKKEAEMEEERRKREDTFKKRNKLFLPQKIQIQEKSTFPVQYEDSRIERHFKKLSEEAKAPIDAEIEQKESIKKEKYKQSSDQQEERNEKQELLLVRFRDGRQKWIRKQKIKKKYDYMKDDAPVDNERLAKVNQTKQVVNPIESERLAAKSLIKNQGKGRNEYLEKQIQSVKFKYRSEKNALDKTMTQYLQQELYINYQQSITKFEQEYKSMSIAPYQLAVKKSNPIPLRIKAQLQAELYCAQGLDFIQQYNLNKQRYIKLFVQSYSITSQFKNNFIHLDKLFTINIAGDPHQPSLLDPDQFTSAQKIAEEVCAFFSLKKDKLEQVVFSVEEHIQKLETQVTKDIEYFIKLNPRFQKNDFKTPLNSYSRQVSLHLSKVLNSVIAHNLFKEFTQFVAYVENWVANTYRGLNIPSLPHTDFYDHVFTCNHPLYFVLELPLEKQVILASHKFNPKLNFHAPGLIPIKLELRKLKRRRYVNIYKFLLLTRQLIRYFDYENPEFIKKMQKLQFYHTEPRIKYEKPLKLLDQLIIDPLESYFDQLRQAQNVNGCIYNTKIQLHFTQSHEYKQIKQRLKESVVRLEKSFVEKYVEYFSLWEIYLSEKPYLEDLLGLYKTLNIISAIRQEYESLEKDLSIIKSFPSIISFKFFRLNISEIKSKIIDTIESHKGKILKECEGSVSRMLEFGYQQTQKARKYAAMINYNSLEEYLVFVSIMNNREMEKSVAKIANNILVINSNMKFLEKTHYPIRVAILKHFLDCRVWVKDLRQKSFENKKKVTLDPEKFIKDINQTKVSIYHRYFRILKDIIELMKVTEAKKINRFSMLAAAIQAELTELCTITKRVSTDQKILQLEYMPQNLDPSPTPNQANDKAVQMTKSESKTIRMNYRSDLTFFDLEQKFLSKYLEFWMFFGKFKVAADATLQKPILSIDDTDIIKLIRQGTELAFKIKHTTLNKKILHLVQEMNKEIEPFLRNFNLFHIFLTGSETFRKQLLHFFAKIFTIPNFDANVVTVKQFLAYPTQNLNMNQIFSMREHDLRSRYVFNKVSAFVQYLKLNEVKKVNLKIGELRELTIIRVDNDLLIAVDQFKSFIQKIVLEFEKKRVPENEDLEKDEKNSDYDELKEVSKKVEIFYNFLQKFKEALRQIPANFGFYQFICPIVLASEQKSSFSYLKEGAKIFENMKADLSLKSQLISKLSFSFVFNDKMKINYSEEVKKLEECSVRFYDDVFKRSNLLQKIQECHSLMNVVNKSTVKHAIFGHLAQMNEQIDEEELSKVFLGCRKLNIMVEHEAKKRLEEHAALRLIEMETIFGEKISTNFLFNIIQQHKEVANLNQEKPAKTQAEPSQKDSIPEDNEVPLKKEDLKPVQLTKETINSWFELGIISQANNYFFSMQKILKYQFFNYFEVIYSVHYGIKQLFQIFISFDDMFLQTVLFSMNVAFWMDLSFVWENKYDLSLFYAHLKLQAQTGYEPMEQQSKPFVQQISILVRCFEKIAKFLLDIDNEFEEEEAHKTKKIFAYNFMAQLRLPEQKKKLSECKKWIQSLKKQKEDNFIMFTHENPLIDSIQFNKIEFHSIELRQVQKKEMINMIDSQQRAEDFFVKIPELETFSLSLQQPLLREVGLVQEQSMKFYPYFELLTENSVTESYESCCAATLFSYARLNGKIFVTNVELNHVMMGKSFVKSHTYQYCPNVNFLVYCRTQQDLIRELQAYIKFKAIVQILLRSNQYPKNQVYSKSYDPKLKYSEAMRFQIQPQIFKPELFSETEVYFYCDKFSYQSIQGLSFGQHIECFLIQKNGMDNIADEISLQQKIVIQRFLKAPSSKKINALRLFGKGSSDQKVIDKFRLKNNLTIEIKQKQALVQMVEKYNGANDYTQVIDEEILYAMKLTHFVAEDISLVMESFDIINFNSKKYKQSQDISASDLLKKPVASDDKNSWVASQENSSQVNLYVIPTYLLTVEQVMGFYSETTYENELQDKFKQSIQHVEVLRKPFYQEGILRRVTSSISSGKVDQSLKQFLQAGNPFVESCSQWYVFDLSIKNADSEEIVNLLLGEFVWRHSFTCPDGKTVHFSFTTQSPHKIIYLLNEEFIQKLTKGHTEMLPLPVVQLPDKFNPISYMERNVKYGILREFGKSKKMKQKYLQWINGVFYSNVQLSKGNHNESLDNRSFKLGQIYDRPVIELATKIVNIQLNQIRKYYISVGYYEEKDLLEEESTLNMFSSTELKEKAKSKDSGVTQQLQHIQEIEKLLDMTRKKIYKAINQSEDINMHVRKDTETLLREKLSFFDPLLIDHPKLYQKILHSTLFALFYSLRLNKQRLLKGINEKYGNDLENSAIFDSICEVFVSEINKISQPTKKSAINSRELHNYFYSLSQNSWQEWQQISNQILDTFSCTSSVVCSTLHLSQAIRLNPNIKKPFLKQYFQFWNNFHQKKPSAILNFDYRNFFAKLFLIYEVGFEWDLGDMNVIEKREFLRDLVHVKNGYDSKLADSPLFVNAQLNFELQLSQTNKRLNKCVEDLKDQSMNFVIVDLDKEPAKLIQKFKTVQKYRICPTQYQEFAKVETSRILFLKSPSENTGLHQNNYSLNSIESSANYLQMLYIYNREFFKQASLFRQNFIAIILLIKFYANSHIFTRILRIMNSLQRFKTDDKSQFLLNLFKMHGIKIYWKQQNHFTEPIQNSEEFASLRLVFFDIVPYVSVLINEEEMEVELKEQLFRNISQANDKYGLKWQFASQCLTREQFCNLKESEIKLIITRVFNRLIEQQVNTKLTLRYCELLKSEIVSKIPQKNQGQKQGHEKQQQSARGTQTNHPSFILRYMLKKPKKYTTPSKDQSSPKKKAGKKSLVSKPNYNDILPYTRQIEEANKKQLGKDFVIYNMNLARQLFFFEMVDEKFLLVKLKIPLSLEVYKKYINAFKLYIKSKEESREKPGKTFTVSSAQTDLEKMNFDDELFVQTVKVTKVEPNKTQYKLLAKDSQKYDFLFQAFETSAKKRPQLFPGAKSGKQSRQQCRLTDSKKRLGLTKLISSNSVSQLSSPMNESQQTQKTIAKVVKELNFVPLANCDTVNQIIEELMRNERDQAVVDGWEDGECQQDIVYRKYVIFVPGEQLYQNAQNDYDAEKHIPFVVEDNLAQVKLQKEAAQGKQDNNKDKDQIEAIQFFTKVIAQKEQKLPIMFHSTLQQKFTLISQSLKSHTLHLCTSHFKQSPLYKQYIQLSEEKLFQIKTNTQKLKASHEQKAASIKQLSYELKHAANNFDILKKKLEESEDMLKGEMGAVSVVKNKEMFYVGEQEFLAQNKRLRSCFQSIKQVEKLLLSEHYHKTETNPYLYFIVLFNILADSQFYADRYSKYMEIEAEFTVKSGNVELDEHIKKNISKLINYGRLTAIIENQSMLNGDTLTDEQLNFVMKFTNKFTELKKIAKRINMAETYSEGNLYSINGMCESVFAVISQATTQKQPLVVEFHKYLLTLFIHKYIRLQIIKKSKDSKTIIANIESTVSELKGKIVEAASSKDTLESTLQQVIQKELKSKEELQASLNSEKEFIEIMEHNVSRMAEKQILFKTGLQIDVTFKYTPKPKLQTASLKTTKLGHSHTASFTGASLLTLEESYENTIRDHSRLLRLSKDILFPSLLYQQLQSQQFSQELKDNLQLLVFLNGATKTSELILDNSITQFSTLYHTLRTNLLQELSFSVTFIDIDISANEHSHITNSHQLSKCLVSVETYELLFPALPVALSPLNTFLLHLYPQLKIQCISFLERFQAYYSQTVESQLISKGFFSKVSTINVKQLQSIRKWKIQPFEDFSARCHQMTQKISSVQDHQNLHHLYHIFQTQLLQFEGSNFVKNNLSSIKMDQNRFSKILSHSVDTQLQNSQTCNYFAKLTAILYLKCQKNNQTVTEGQSILPRIYRSLLKNHNHSLSALLNQQLMKKIEHGPEDNEQMEQCSLESLLLSKQLTSSLFMVQNRHTFFYEYIDSLLISNGNNVCLQRVEFGQIPDNEQKLQRYLSKKAFKSVTKDASREKTKDASQDKQVWIMTELDCNCYPEVGDQVKLAKNNRKSYESIKRGTSGQISLGMSKASKNSGSLVQNINKRSQFEQTILKLKAIKYILQNGALLNQQPIRIKVIVVIDQQQNSVYREMRLNYLSQMIQPVYRFDISHQGVHSVIDKINHIYSSLEHGLIVDGVQAQTLNVLPTQGFSDCKQLKIEQSISQLNYLRHLATVIFESIYPAQKQVSGPQSKHFSGHLLSSINSILLEPRIVSKWIQSIEMNTEEALQRMNTNQLSVHMLPQKLTSVSLLQFALQITSNKLSTLRHYDIVSILVKSIVEKVMAQLYCSRTHDISKSSMPKQNQINKTQYGFRLDSDIYALCSQINSLQMKYTLRQEHEQLKHGSEKAGLLSIKQTITIPEPQFSSDLHILDSSHQPTIKPTEKPIQPSDINSLPIQQQNKPQAQIPQSSSQPNDIISDNTMVPNSMAYQSPEMLLQLQTNTNKMLSDPHVYVVINNAFRKVIAKLLKRRLQKLKSSSTSRNHDQQNFQTDSEPQTTTKPSLVLENNPKQSENPVEHISEPISRDETNKSHNSNNPFSLLAAIAPIFKHQIKPQRLLSFDQFCFEQFKFSKKHHLKLQDIAVVLSHNHTQEEFDSLFTRSKSYNQGMDLVGHLFHLAAKDQMSSKNIEGNKSQVNANSSKINQNTADNTKKTQQKKRKHLTLKLANPFPRKYSSINMLNSPKINRHSTNEPLQQGQHPLNVINLFDITKSSDISQRYTMLPRNDLKVQNHKTEGINFKYFEPPQLIKRSNSLVINNQNMESGHGSFEDLDQMEKTKTLKYFPQYLTMLPVVYNGQKIGVMEMRTNTKVFTQGELVEQKHLRTLIILA